MEDACQVLPGRAGGDPGPGVDTFGGTFETFVINRGVSKYLITFMNLNLDIYRQNRWKEQRDATNSLAMEADREASMTQEWSHVQPNFLSEHS